MQIRFSFFKMKIQGILIVPADMYPHMETGHGPGCRTWPGMQDMARDAGHETGNGDVP